MKIYVAARFQDKEKVKEIYKKLKDRGHTISGDWTNHTHTKPYKENQELSKEYSIEDMNNILNCDVFILLTNQEPGIGSTTELGGALALYIKNKSPKVYIVGDNLDGNMFYFHPEVNVKSTLEEVLEDLDK